MIMSVSFSIYNCKQTSKNGQTNIYFNLLDIGRGFDRCSSCDSVIVRIAILVIEVVVVVVVVLAVVVTVVVV